MNVRVISSCTNEKAVETADQLTTHDFEKGHEHVMMRERELMKQMLPSEQMYTGQQHVRVMRGIQACAAKSRDMIVDLFILSAGYGLIPGSRAIAPYNSTFQGMSPKCIAKLADQLDVPNAFRTVISAKFDLCLILLGADYLRACRLDSTIRLGGPTIAFCSGPSAAKYSAIEGLRTVRLPHSGSKNIWLKGEYASRLLRQLSSGAVNPSAAMDPQFDLLAHLDGL